MPCPEGRPPRPAASPHPSSKTNSCSGRRRTGPCRPAGRPRAIVAAMKTCSGTSEQRAQLRLHHGVPAGEHTAIPQCPGGQQEVLAGRVDRCPLSGRRVAVPLEARQHDDRDAFEVLDELRSWWSPAELWARSRPCHSPCRSDPPASLFPTPVARPSPISRRASSGPGPVAQHQKTERLTVGPTGRPCGREQHGGKRIVGNRLGRESPDGTGGCNPLEESQCVVLLGHVRPRSSRGTVTAGSQESHVLTGLGCGGRPRSPTLKFRSVLPRGYPSRPWSMTMSPALVSVRKSSHSVRSDPRPHGQGLTGPDRS